MVSLQERGERTAKQGQEQEQEQEQEQGQEQEQEQEQVLPVSEHV